MRQCRILHSVPLWFFLLEVHEMEKAVTPGYSTKHFKRSNAPQEAGCLPFPKLCSDTPSVAFRYLLYEPLCQGTQRRRERVVNLIQRLVWPGHEKELATHFAIWTN